MIEGGKPENPEKNPCGMRKNTLNKLNSKLKLNPGHSGEWPVLSPLSHPCHPILLAFYHLSVLFIYLM